MPEEREDGTVQVSSCALWRCRPSLSGHGGVAALVATVVHQLRDASPGWTSLSCGSTDPGQVADLALIP
ncbi:hypothetical protein ACFOX2_11985 [Corynebacterium marambiense]|uniref:hypothetical protein n=1 Tax=Corynebacterium marambiense TaxID=2765364 RepID=UPI00360C4432